jgi:predicted phage tail protein
MASNCRAPAGGALPCHAHAMLPGFSDVGKMLRLDDWPLLRLVCSALALLTVCAWTFHVTPTEALSFLFVGLLLPAAPMQEAMSNVHEWMVTTPRDGWVAWGTVTFAIAIAARYVWGWREQRSVSDEARAAAVSARHLRDEALRNPLLERDALEAERVKHSHFEERVEVQRHEADVAGRLAALAWVCALVATEVGGWLPIVLGVVAVAMCVALFVVNSESKVAFRIQLTVMDVVLFLFLAGIALIALPGFIVAQLFTPARKRPATAAGGTAD